MTLKPQRRALLCSLCTYRFKTTGTMRVIRYVVLTFCRACWTNDRNACESFCQGAAEPIPPPPPPEIKPPKRPRGQRGRRRKR